MGPRRSRVSAASRSIAAASDASATAVSIDGTSSFRDFKRSARRAAAITLAPSLANSTAVARPMPLDAPTTRTTCFSKLTIISSILNASRMDVRNYHKCMRLFLCAALAVSAYAQTPFPAAQALDDTIQQAIEQGRLPGAVLVIGHNGSVVYRKAY